jgi:hypothetical protein
MGNFGYLQIFLFHFLGAANLWLANHANCKLEVRTANLWLASRAN